MSHWKDIEIDLNCSIEVLRRILINIMPRWEEYIRVDPSGGLTAVSKYEPNRPVNGCSIVIPMGDGTGVSGADIGFVQTSINKWKMRYDYKPREAQDIENLIKQEYATIHTIAEAQAKNLQIVSNEEDGNDNIVRILVPADFNPQELEQ